MTGQPRIRPATRADVPAIVRLLADDVLGSQRESTPNGQTVLPAYDAAFAAIAADPHQWLMVMELDGVVIGTLQLTLIPGLAHRGRWRGLVEAVHVDSRHRSKGYGEQLMHWAIAHAKVHGCGLVQLTSNQVRTDAHRFYKRLGFVASHVGMKLAL